MRKLFLLTKYTGLQTLVDVLLEQGHSDDILSIADVHRFNVLLRNKHSHDAAHFIDQQYRAVRRKEWDEPDARIITMHPMEPLPFRDHGDYQNATRAYSRVNQVKDVHTKDIWAHKEVSGTDAIMHLERDYDTLTRLFLSEPHHYLIRAYKA